MATASVLAAILAQTQITTRTATGLAVGALIFIILSIVLRLACCVAIGYWAGKIAQDKGRSFGGFFALGFVATLCGLLPGILVVVILYVMEPAGGAIAPGVPHPVSWTHLCDPPDSCRRPLAIDLS